MKEVATFGLGRQVSALQTPTAIIRSLCRSGDRVETQPRGAGEDVGGMWGASAAGAGLGTKKRCEIRTPAKPSRGVRSCKRSRGLSRSASCRLFSSSVSGTLWGTPGESKCQRKGFNALHCFCPRFLSTNLHVTSSLSYRFSSLLRFPRQAFFSPLGNDVKQIPNVIFSADARKLEEVYYSSVQYSFQRKLLVRSIYLALYTALILT